MAVYMDIHKNVQGVTPEEVAEAHRADVQTQGAYDVKYLRWWFNREAGSIYCMVEAPSKDAAIEVHRQAHGLLPDEIIEIEPGEVEEMIGPDEHGPAYREDPVDRISTDTAFRTIVFTDLVDSTRLNQRLGDDAYVDLLERHDNLMAECLRSHGGCRVKHTGDGMMASFASVAKAVQCMVDMQRALDEYNASLEEIELRARMAAAAGEPVERNNDLFGAAVTLAARLRDQAQAGQILVASVIRDLCVGKGFAFDEFGDVSLKGFDEPTRVYVVRWS